MTQQNYKWDYQAPHLDRSVSGRASPSGQRVVTDAGNPRPRITPNVSRADLDRRDNPADRSNGLRPGEPTEQGRDDAEAQAFIDRALSGEFDRRQDERRRQAPQEHRDTWDAYDARRESPNANRGDFVDRRYLAFPEAHGSDAETTEKRHVRIAFGPASKNEERSLIADFFRGILADKNRPHERMKFDINKRLVSTVGADGGYAIPNGYINFLQMPPDPLTSIYDNATKTPVKVNEGTHPIIDTVPVCTYGTETQAFDESEPGLDQGTYTLLRRSAMTKMTMNAVEDSDPDLLKMVMDLLNQALKQSREEACAIGNPNTGMPTGIYYSTGITDVSGITAVNWANLNKLLFSVDIRFHSDPSFRFVMNQTVLGAVSGLVDLQNRPLFYMDPTTAMRPYLMGVPVLVNNSLPNNFIGLGALRFLRIWDRGILLFDTTREAGDAWSKNQLWARISERQGSKYVKPPTATSFVRSRLLTGIS